jgi:hypothetical protein
VAFGGWMVKYSCLLPASVSTCQITINVHEAKPKLIEGLEPPQNRKRGDDFTAIEYL